MRQWAYVLATSDTRRALDRGRDLLVQHAPRLLAISWAVLVGFAFSPGQISHDTLMQTRDGLAGHYNNWHPPMLSWMLGRSVGAFGSPAPLFAIQLLSLGMGIAQIFSRGSRRTWLWRSAFTGIVLCLPPVWAVANTLWKDVWMAIALVWAVAFACQAMPGRALVCLFVAALFRHNALTAVVPLLVLAPKNGTPLERLSAVKGAAVTACLVLAILVAPRGVEALFAAEDGWPGGSLVWFDLVGVYVQKPALLAASSARDAVDSASLQATYYPDSVSPLFWGAEHLRKLPVTSLPARRPALMKEWWKVVRSEPGAYAAHRWKVFTAMLSANPHPVCGPFHTQIDPNPWGFVLPTGSALHQTLVRWRTATRNTIVFRGWFWMGLLIVVAGGAALRGGRSWPTTLALSGLSYGSAYLFVGVGCDFRYVYWSVLAALIALGLALLQALDGNPPNL